MQKGLAGACPPASPPTLSQSSLLICSIQVYVSAGVPVPRAGECFSGAEAGGCKRSGNGCWRQWWESSPRLLACDFFFHSSSWSVLYPHLCPLPSPSLSLQCLSQCPEPSPSAEETPWLALQVMEHDFGQGTPHVPSSFQLPVHGAPSPLHPAHHVLPGEEHQWHPMAGSPSLLGAHWGQQPCRSLPSVMQIPGRMGWGQGEAMDSLGFLWCVVSIISYTRCLRFLATCF